MMYLRGRWFGGEKGGVKLAIGGLKHFVALVVRIISI